MAAENLTTREDIEVLAREIDFTTRFGRNWTGLLQIMGIMRPIEKAPGVVLKFKYAEVTLQSGAVGEGEAIPLSHAKVKTKDYATITLKKHKKAVSAEAIIEHGYDVAVQMTDEQFLYELTAEVWDTFYDFLRTGQLTGTAPTFQMALARAQGMVRNRWRQMRRTITRVVGFCNINAAYDYLGAANITVQNQFGMNYIQNFLGYSTLFLCSDNEIPPDTVIALPVENIVLYYVNPANADLEKAGLKFTVDGITNLIGFHAQGNYDTDVSECSALSGMVLFSEYQDGIAVVRFGNVLSDDDTPSARLSALTIGNLALSPTFDPDTTTYTASTSNATNTITVTAEDSEATVEIKVGETTVTNGTAATWADGENTLTITVTNGTETKTYTVTMTKN